MLRNRAERERAVAWVHRAATFAAPPLPENPSDAFLVGWHQAVRDMGDPSPTDQITRNTIAAT